MAMIYGQHDLPVGARVKRILSRVSSVRTVRTAEAKQYQLWEVKEAPDTQAYMALPLCPLRCPSVSNAAINYSRVQSVQSWLEPHPRPHYKKDGLRNLSVSSVQLMSLVQAKIHQDTDKNAYLTPTYIEC